MQEYAVSMGYEPDGGYIPPADVVLLGRVVAWRPGYVLIGSEWLHGWGNDGAAKTRYDIDPDDDDDDNACLREWLYVMDDGKDASPRRASRYTFRACTSKEIALAAERGEGLPDIDCEARLSAWRMPT